MKLTVAIIGTAHGIKGEVKLDVRTDDPETRLAVGNVLETDPADEGPLTVARVRKNKDITLASFVGITDRNAAEGLRGVKLIIETDEEERSFDQEAYYAHELAGCDVIVQDKKVGRVLALELGVAHDFLVIEEAGQQILVPFVEDIVPQVDIDNKQVYLTPPGGIIACIPSDESDNEVAD